MDNVIIGHQVQNRAFLAADRSDRRHAARDPVARRPSEVATSGIAMLAESASASSAEPPSTAAAPIAANRRTSGGTRLDQPMKKTGRCSRGALRHGFWNGERVDAGARWVRARVDQESAPLEAEAIGGDAFGKGWRGAAVLQAILVAVPWASDAAGHDPSFAERPILVRAEIAHRGERPLVPEDCHRLGITQVDHE